MDTTRPSLLIRIRDRADGDAWRTFDDIYRPILFRFARDIGLTVTDAEDVAQECLSAVSDHIREFDYDPHRGRFKGWLRTLVNNRVRNLLRSRRGGVGDAASMNLPQECEDGPEDAFERVWMEEHLRHCLERLRGEVDERTFTAFERYVIDEQPADEVAGALGLSVNNLYTIKWRLTHKISEQMRELTGELE